MVSRCAEPDRDRRRSWVLASSLSWPRWDRHRGAPAAPFPLAVGFVGDSITDGAGPELRARFGVDDDDIEAVSGTRSRKMPPGARALAGAYPKQVVDQPRDEASLLSGEPLPAGPRPPRS